jgi:hypothetical protein
MGTVSSKLRATARTVKISARFRQGRRHDGEKCRARPIVGSGYCFFHDPAKAAKRAAAQSAGDQRIRIAVLPATAPDARLLDAGDLVNLLADTINQVRRGEIDPRVANAIGYLGGLILKACTRPKLRTIGCARGGG